MIHRVLPVIVGLTTLLLTACVSPPLRRPAILGASASAGVGAEVDHRDRPTHVDLESVLLAALARRGSEPVMLADPSFYVDPPTVALEQIEAAEEARPTLIVAIDYLFWSIHGARFNRLAEATRATESGTPISAPDEEPSHQTQETHETHGTHEIRATDTAAADAAAPENTSTNPPTRLASLDTSLAHLDRFDIPIIVGDIPDMAASADRGMPAAWLPSSVEVAEANDRIRAWAAQRPNVVLLPIAELVREAEASEETSENNGESDHAPAALMQEDNLHPTAEGLIAMCLAALTELEARGLIKPADYHVDDQRIRTRLPAVARKVESSRRGGPFALLRLVSLSEEFSEAIDAMECERATRIGQELFNEASELRTPPDDAAGVMAWFTLGAYARCADAGTDVLRWREQISPKIQVSRPDPWPLELWSVLNDLLGQERITLDRLLELQREIGDLAPYENVVDDMYRGFIRTGPSEVMSLLPDIQPRVQSLNRRVADAVERSKKPIQRTKATQNMEKWKWQFRAGKTDEQIEQDIRDMYDPLVQLEKQLADLAVRYAELERALRIAARHPEAEAVHAAAEQGMGPDRYAAAQQRLADEIAQAAEHATP